MGLGKERGLGKEVRGLERIKVPGDKPVFSGCMRSHAERREMHVIRVSRSGQRRIRVH